MARPSGVGAAWRIGALQAASRVLGRVQAGGALAGCRRSWPKAGQSAATVRTDAVRPPEGAGGGARRRGRGRAGGGCEAAVRMDAVRRRRTCFDGSVGEEAGVAWHGGFWKRAWRPSRLCRLDGTTSALLSQADSL